MNRQGIREAAIASQGGVLVALSAVTAACSDLPNFGAEDPASEEGRRILELWQVFFIAAAIVGALVFGLILWTVVRYRRRSDDLPPQNHGNNALEIVYTAIPIIIVIGLFALTMVTQVDIDELSDAPDVVVEALGFQWQWQFTYADEDVVVTGMPNRTPEIVLPVGATVRFKLESRDVIHSFFVPNFLFKRDVIPGVDNEFDVTVTEAGSYTGVCAEFCGLLHDRMEFHVRTVPGAEYDAWIAEQRT